MQTLVRNLKPGDILPANNNFSVQRAVVLGVGKSNGNIVVTLITLLSNWESGTPMPPPPMPFPTCAQWDADGKVEIEQPAALDKFIAVARTHESFLMSHCDEYYGPNYITTANNTDPVKDLLALRELLLPFPPPAPPTLSEAIDVIRALVGPATGWSSTADDAARKLLARVPK